MPIEGFGGLEIQTLMRVEDALNSGFESLAIVKENTRIYEYCVKKGMPFLIVNQKWKYFDPQAISKLGKIIREQDTDIIVVPKTELLSIAIIARNMNKKNCSILLYQQMQSGIKKKDPFHNYIYNNLDGAIVLTKRMKDQLTETTIFPANKISVVPYGIDIEKFNFNIDKALIRKEFKLPENAFIIGNIARIEEKKDQHTILQAFNELNIDNKFLVFCGNVDNSSYFDKLINFVKTNNLSERFKYIQFTYDIPKLMNCFDLFILSTPAETFGLVIIEAMASRVPVIATNCDGVREIIKHNTNGLLFNAGNYIELKDLIEYISKNNYLYNYLVNNAYNNVKNSYSYQMQTQLFYRTCLDYHLKRNNL